MSGNAPFDPPGGPPPQQPPYGSPPQGPPPQQGGGFQPEYGYQPPAVGVPPAGQPGQFQAPTPGHAPQQTPQPGWQQPGSFPQGAPPQPPRSRAPWIILGIVAAFLVLLIGGCAALILFVSTNDEARELVSELAIDFTDGVPATGPTSCEVDGLDFADDYRVFTVVTNESGVTSHYLIDYELTGPDGEFIGTDFGIVSDLGAGETVRDNAAGVVDGDVPPDQVTCTVTGATRVPADG